MNIQENDSTLPPRMVIYGDVKIGKTTFACGAPNPVLIPVEEGFRHIKGVNHFPLVTRSGDVVTAIRQLCEEKHDYQTVILDTIDELEKMIWAEICKQSGSQSINQAMGGYGAGIKAANAQIKTILNALTILNKSRNVIVIVLAHAVAKRFEDPENPAYDRWTLNLHSDAADTVTAWADEIYFAERRYTVKDNDGDKKQAVAIGKDERRLRTIGGPSCMAGYRLAKELPEFIPLNWAAYMEAVYGK